jgi:dipeptidyl aminopeptidase/acylaminoacyl peptidase
MMYTPDLRLTLFGLAAAATLACGVTSSTEEAAPAPRTVPEYSIGQFLDTTSYRGAGFSPDKTKLLVSSDQTGIFNAYAFPVDGGEPVALTRSTAESIFALGYFANDERFLYTADQGGNELNHIYVQTLEGEAIDLTPGDDLKAQFLGWNHDDSAFFVATNERDPKYFDIYTYDAQGYERELLFTNEQGLSPAAISPDGRYVALVKNVTNADSDAYLFDSKTDKLVNITTDAGDINYSPQDFTLDGKSLLLTTDRDSEFTHVVRYDLEDGSWQPVESANWDIAFTAFSKTGKYRVSAINNDGRTELRLYDGATGDSIALPALPGAEVSSVSFSRDDSMMAFYASTSRSPRDLYVQTIGGEPRRLTQSLTEEINQEDLIEPEVVRFASYDGVEIPGILYKPWNASEEAKAPALVMVHGGPGGQSRVGYSDLVQYLVNHGYVVYAINNRGSSGYGKTFFHMDDRAHGSADLDDCVAAKQMLIDTGYVDPERIGIMGGSYGGYMVLAALAFRPDVFDLGVDIFGVANWYRTLQEIPPWWASQISYFANEFGPLDDEEYLKKISPFFHAENIAKPLLVLQGANDPRVKQAESDDIVEAVKANGVPVEYIVFPDEGHGFRKKENQERGYEAILRFVDQYFSDDAGASSAAAE